MREVSNTNFGVLIATIVPGFVALIGVSYFSETVRGWLGVLDTAKREFIAQPGPK